MPLQSPPVFLGLDLTASRVRAVRGAAGSPAQQPALDGDAADLPMAIYAPDRHLVLGRSALRASRSEPHLVCTGFLQHLTEPRRWTIGRHRLDAAAAVGHICEYLRQRCTPTGGATLAVPPYLDTARQAALTAAANRSRLKVLGVVSGALAAVRAAWEEQPWYGRAIVVDVDDYALTWTVVRVECDSARVAGGKILRHLASRAWHECLMQRVAEHCIRQSRRDPRESAEAEQMLYDQIDEVIHSAWQGHSVDLVLRSASWCQGLSLKPAEVVQACAPLARQAVAELEALSSVPQDDGAGGAVIVTAEAARLPGLLLALEQFTAERAELSRADSAEDFGEALWRQQVCGSYSLHVLPAEAVARVAHDVALDQHAGTVPTGEVKTLPLPAAPPTDVGPARLRFRGQEFPLPATPFSLGRDPASALPFDSSLYPGVSSRHCEIRQERRGFVLIDYSRHGTFVNDRPVVSQVTLQPGDAIRLGPGGPIVRFLGSADRRALTPTA